MFFGEPPRPSVSFPGVDFAVIAKDGYVNLDFAHNTEKGRTGAGEGGAWKEERRGSPVGPRQV